MRRHTWTSLGMPLVCHIWEPTDALPLATLVFLHGFLDHGLAFTPVAETLSTRYRVIIPDHRGHGESGRVREGGYYHFPDYVLDLDALFASLELNRPILVGHSMGASIAIYFAGTFTERVSGLLLLDGLGPPHVRDSEGPSRISRWIEAVQRLEPGTEPEGDSLKAMAARIGKASPRATPERLMSLARTACAQGSDGQWRWRFDPLHRTPAPTPFDVDRFTAFLTAIRCPSRVIWAEHTPFKGKGCASRLASIKGADERILDGCGHNLHHENPEALSHEVDAFAQSVLEQP